MTGLGLGAAWLLGVSVGLTACTVSCLPFMGTWVLGRAGGGAQAFEDASAFIAGRVAGYTLLGAAAGLAGEAAMALLEGGGGRMALGTASLTAAAVLLRWNGRPARPCAAARSKGVPPALMGAAMALVPCAPLAGLVAGAGGSGSVAAGAGLGLAFGLGAAVTPLLAVLPAIGAFGRALAREQAWLGRALRLIAAALLALVGVRELWLAWGVLDITRG